MFDLSEKYSLLGDLLIGTAGGLVGTLAMSAYWRAVSRASGSDPRGETRQTNGQTSSIAILGTHHKEGESSTEALARLGHQAVVHREPRPERKEKLSQAVHWTYGAAQGALFGAIARRLPGPRWLKGLGYGATMWLLGDELAVPAFGLADGPAHFPMRQHLHRFGAHLAYGAGAAATTSVLGRLFTSDRPRPAR